jgi:steroid delta-isomerase-like uncharacterized protein
MASEAQEEQNRDVVGQFFEFYNEHNIESIGQLISSSNYSFHLPGMAPLDWNTHKQFIAAIISAFPDFRHNVIDVVAERDKVAVRFNLTGTHKGEFQGIPPTGKKLSLDEMGFITIIDGKITEGWISADTMRLMQQIGAIPADAYAGSSSTAARS